MYCAVTGSPIEPHIAEIKEIADRVLLQILIRKRLLNHATQDFINSKKQSWLILTPTSTAKSALKGPFR